ncbi:MULTISPECIES: YtzH-like family protein [Virgibacillus]|uniref:YtzH-like protein n=2 Tax=Virgibacillus TaxID=84406 RepID=A0A024QAF6_9BACI|nr:MULTISPECIES: YtzH-like family protein [Virgibacillus]EQB35665.1 hypothetical protein M948_11520 [Virgibacillus sp. CM-4]GGJ50644.1 hypothetical protein GCM10007111_11180 [Virgibacillus kapii]CDQ39272.1 hypothetical protein BN990_01566 [Virgibacillus massiliensis]
MTLNTNNQLTLLIDLLDEQKGECCGHVSEYQQISRLVQSLMNNNNVTDQELLRILPEIYSYGKDGEIVENIEDHITANDQNLASWLHALHQTSER